ncbi:transcriptional regulator, TetR family protein [Hyphomonas adhaerens MHS-3]|uniref:Transcriptional regulator, TetR family protein n=2 Tax=Hyphomonas adhaerens TaxID=81029 RepID=A0A069E085_9PROT|nr:transcriptional regulator, TetR family protein [Hyphomonas adhaerens MHS-3]
MPGSGQKTGLTKRTPANDLRQAPEGVELETKVSPSQDRARNTFESILSVTGDLLSEVGFERLSTNMICKRAGLTPPALYRYFPNKYAILHELGRRLMEAQDQAVFEWLQEGGIDTQSFEASTKSILRIQRHVNEITKSFPGGAWVVRVMRVIPVLKEVRLESRDLVSDKILEDLRTKLPDVPEDRLAMATKLTIELMFSATEMAIETPEQEDEITQEVSFLVASYHWRLKNDS